MKYIIEYTYFMNKIEWNAPEYIHTDKNVDWYWIVGIVTVTIVLVSIILNNIIFGVLIFVSGFALSLTASRKPKDVLVVVDDFGIKIGNVNHPYKNIQSFFIETRDRYPRILIRTDKPLSPLIKILIDIDMADEIENKLSEHIQMEDLSESIFEKILIFAGF